MGYEIKEIYLRKEGRKIYGKLFTPDSGSRHPLVIFSHEFGVNHLSGIIYARYFAEIGYATLTFDFCGGSCDTVRNKSDGTSLEMSIISEKEDLEAVIDEAKTFENIDANRLVLVGASQGGVVSLLAAAERKEEISAMILLYPALVAFDDARKKKEEYDGNLPETVEMFGGIITVSKRYFEDIIDMDTDEILEKYKNKVLLLHGDKDEVVPLSYSVHAAETFENCEFHIIENGAHGFGGEAFKKAMSYIMPFLENQR